PTVSTTTKLRPVPTRRSRLPGSTRSGSTISSLRPGIEATFCVATTLPVTLARNMALPPPFSGRLRDPPRPEEPLGLPAGAQLLVGRHGPQLHPAAFGVDRHLALGCLVLPRVEGDAEPVEVRADALANPGRVLPDAAGEHDGVGAVEQQEVGP